MWHSQVLPGYPHCSVGAYANGKVSQLNNVQLMIFMRSLLSTAFGQCQVRSSNTDLVIASLYKVVMRFMTTPTQNACNHLLMRLISINGIHGPLGVGNSLGRAFVKGLGLKSTSGTQVIASRFWPSPGPLNKPSFYACT